MVNVPAIAETGLTIRRLSDHEKALDTSVISFVHDNSVTQVAFLLLGFSRCNVAQTCAVALYFPGASNLESLLGAGVGLHFRHNKNVF